jgi:hypothetical protein
VFAVARQGREDVVRRARNLCLGCVLVAQVIRRVFDGLRLAALPDVLKRWGVAEVQGGDRLDAAADTLDPGPEQDLPLGLHVFVEPEDYAAWLDPENKDAEGLLTMLRPTDPAPWMLRKDSRKVNSPKNDSPEIIEPVTA